MCRQNCKYPVLKRAFLFSCLTGLRWSDVYKLKWSEIEQDSNGRYSIVFKQKKTEDYNYLPLSEQALNHIGARKHSNANVFTLPYYSSSITKNLQAWCECAGIEKQITYHCSRHGFAVMQLSLGTELFTLQKLLGHINTASTMVYADIVDTEKERAMDIVPDIF